MEISKSIFLLTKSNNGFFKSEKQANYLISKMIAFEGVIGYADSGYHSCPIFAEWDKKGITKLTKHTKNGNALIFERKTAGVLTALEVKHIKFYEKKLKQAEKEFFNYKKSFESGNYNKTGDITTYTACMIENYNYFQNQRMQQINNLKQTIYNLKNK